MENKAIFFKLLIEKNYILTYLPLFMFKRLNKLKLFLVATFLIVTTTVFSSEKNITYMQILQKPNDLDLNLKYAQQ